MTKTLAKKVSRTEDMTTTAYARKIGITLQGVHKRVKDGNPLPGVTEIKRYSRQWIFVVDIQQLSEYLKKSSKKVV